MTREANAVCQIAKRSDAVVSFLIAIMRGYGHYFEFLGQTELGKYFRSSDSSDELCAFMNSADTIASVITVYDVAFLLTYQRKQVSFFFPFLLSLPLSLSLSLSPFLQAAATTRHALTC